MMRHLEMERVIFSGMVPSLTASSTKSLSTGLRSGRFSKMVATRAPLFASHQKGTVTRVTWEGQCEREGEVTVVAMVWVRVRVQG